MDQVVRASLNPTSLRGMFSAIDAVGNGKKPEERSIESATVELERYAPKHGARWRAKDPCIAVVREALTTIKVPWFTVPRRTGVTNECIQNFLRSLRKKCRSVQALDKTEREALHNVLLFLVERLPGV